MNDEVMKNQSACWAKLYSSTSKDIHIPMPQICEYVTWHGNRDFIDVIDLGPWDGEIMLD